MTKPQIGQSFYFVSASSVVENGVVYVTQIGRKKMRVSFTPDNPTGKEFEIDIQTRQYVGASSAITTWGIKLYDTEQDYLDYLDSRHLATEIHFMLSPDLGLEKLNKIKCFIEELGLKAV